MLPFASLLLHKREGEESRAMDAVSISGLNPAAPPFTPEALVPAKAQYISPPPAALLPASVLPPQCIYPPPPACWSLVACGCRCGAGFASKGCTCERFVWEGVPALPRPAWVHPRPVSAAAVYYYTPLPPRPANRCCLKELGNDSDEAANAEAGDEPSACSVMPTMRRAALPPPPPPSPPPPRAFRGKPRRGRRARLAFDPSADATALMIRNIPNKFMKGRLMAILDQHCAEENAKLPPGGGAGAVKSEYDFLYVPVDFRTECNKGYAFVNMTTATAAQRLHAFLQGHRWEAASSRKVCDVVQARIGGLDAFVGHFSGSQFPCDKEEFLPVRFEPPRDGVQKTAEHVVGRLARGPR